MTVPRALLRVAARTPLSVQAVRALQAFALPNSVSVLMYHGVTAEPLPVADPCFTSVAAFTRQMEYLARHFRVLHVEEALEPERSRTDRPVACVTFDDGFASVHDYAWPVLRKLGIPATVYLVTDLIDSDDTVWFALLHQALAHTSATQAECGEEQLPLESLADRSRASSRLQAYLKALSSERFGAAFEEVLDQLGFAPRGMTVRHELRILSSDQIRRLSHGGLLRFGAHTATHQILTRTSADRARREIESSVHAVSQLVERPSDSFAYPNGGKDDFDANTIVTLQRLGIRFGLTTIPGPNEAHTDPYRIRRYTIGAEEQHARFAFLAHNARAAAFKVSRFWRGS